MVAMKKKTHFSSLQIYWRVIGKKKIFQRKKNGNDVKKNEIFVELN